MLRELTMKKNNLLAAIFASAIWLCGCSMIRVAGPPCVGNSCPAGVGGQLPGVATAAYASNNAPVPQNNAQAKSNDTPPQHRSLASRLHLTHGQ